MEAQRADADTIGRVDILKRLPFWSTRGDGYLDYANDLWLGCADLSLDEARGSGWRSSIHPDDLAGFTSVWQALMESGEEGYAEARLGSAASGWRWYLSRAFPVRDDEAGPVVRWYGVLFDISDRKRVEQSLKLSEAYLAQAQRLSRTGSFGVNFGDGTLYWSEETYRIFDYPPSQPLSLDAIWSYVHPDDLPQVRQALELCETAWSGLDVRYRIVLRDGTVKNLRALGQVQAGPSGARELIGAVIDVTAAQLAEERLLRTHAELAQAGRVMVLGELAASIVHEVNQPLAAIVAHGGASLRWLERDAPDIGEAVMAIRHMVSDAERAADVIRRLRAFGREEAPSRTLVDVNDLILATLPLIGLQGRGKAVERRLCLEPNLPEVRMDQVQLQQVLINLVSNSAQAIEQSPQAGTGMVQIRSRLDGSGDIVIEVCDTGPGFDDHQLARLFEPFFTTRKGGVGLGLSICRSIIEAHGGSICASNRAGGGACMEVRMPAGAKGGSG
ncbi:ATP-binding protein [Cupriavidus sp. 30B13]|uniref:ATP-binding protein n=1 Tax=Cupriavidus sp. 30B13 TaxID=3384241 RepID=UPI003B901921